ncbi:MAG: glycosyltransferase [Paracoccaceae bacterium]
MRILQLTADHPDPLVPNKAKAVANLIGLADRFQHRVVSLNRVGWRQGIEALDFADTAGPAHRAVAYGAPPKGLFLKHFLDRLADWIQKDCAAAGFAPDIIHAHKLSVEGLMGETLARRWGVPLVISVQGDSDLLITGAKRNLRPIYSRIWRGAAAAFPFTPWAAERLDALLGAREGPTYPLPCPGPADARMQPRAAPPVIVSAFHFSSASRKNAAALIRATGRAAAEIPDIRLEIIGGGDPAAFARLSALARNEAPGRVDFLGALANSEMQKRFNAACGFALVSKRESYGMVFAEALLAGAPCLIPKGWGIDGYFEEGSVVISADPMDEDDILRGLLRLVREQDELKARLAALGDAGGLDLLTRAAIRETYISGMEAVMEGKTSCAV